MKNKKTLFAVILIFFLVIGVTIAYFSSTASFENIFNTGTYKLVTTEVFESPDNWMPGDEVSKTITTKNEGTIPAAVRVSYTEQWLDDEDNDITSTIDEGTAIINLDNTSDWTKEGNYYYYKYILNPNETTSSFIKSVTLNPNLNGVTCTGEGLTRVCESTNPATGAKYKLTITKETVQADKYKEVWNTNLEITEKPSSAVQQLISKATPTTNEKEPVSLNHVQTEQTDATTDYRYMGSNPNNYVLFNCSTDNLDEQNSTNCETWRIIGVVDGKVKLRRTDSIGNIAWDENDEADWPDSALFNYLNNDYYNSLSESAKSKIADAKWYLGSWKSEWRGEELDGITYMHGWDEDVLYSTSVGYGIFPEGAYKAERGTEVYNDFATNVTAKVGLLYVSDYLYSSSQCYSSCIATSQTCGNHVGTYMYNAYGYGYYYKNGVQTDILSYNSSVCTGSTWFGSDDTRTITATADTNQIFYLPEWRVSKDYTTSTYPTVYLKNDVILSGSGTAADPYKLD